MTKTVGERAKYWCNQGRFSKEANKLMDQLVPRSGDAPTEHGQLLRYASNIYYDHLNNGGMNLSLKHFRKAHHFLVHRAEQMLPTANELSVKNFRHKIRKFGMFMKEPKPELLDQVMDVVISYVMKLDMEFHAIQIAVESFDSLVSILESVPPHYTSAKNKAGFAKALKQAKQASSQLRHVFSING